MTDLDGQELGDDVIATINALMQSIEARREETGDEPPQMMGMEPSGMIEMLKPQVYQKVQADPQRTLESVALLNQATDDILEKHAESDTETLANRGLNPGDE